LEFTFKAIAVSRKEGIHKILKMETVIVIYLLIMIIELYNEQFEITYKFSFSLLFLGPLVYIYGFWDDHDFYHFGDQYIAGPGPDFKPISYDEITGVSAEIDEDIVYLNLKNGDRIRVKPFKPYKEEFGLPAMTDFINERMKMNEVV
jgi:hypothetical protein